MPQLSLLFNAAGFPTAEELLLLVTSNSMGTSATKK
jgi:hypothetical protein